jgi:hypothetical protein
MLAVSLDCPFFCPFGIRGNKQMAIQIKWQYRVHKKQDKNMLENTEGAIKKDNPEKLAT